MSKVLGFGLLMALAIQMNRSSTVGVELGGAGVACNVATTPVACSGSYVRSAGCGAFTVMRATGWHLTQMLAATSTGDCNTNLDSSNVACSGLANQNILTSYSCSPSWL